jgi:hypothetical protein
LEKMTGAKAWLINKVNKHFRRCRLFYHNTTWRITQP